MAIQKKTIIKWMLTTLWIALGAGTIVLLVAAMHKKETAECKGVDINIHGVSNNFFVDKKDIMNSITRIGGADPAGQPVSSFDLKQMEAELLKNIWVSTAELFFDNNEILKVNVVEREPIARVFTAAGTTFYIDSAVMMLPLSDKFSARLPVFTNFPDDKQVLSKADSNLLRDVKTLSLALQKDSFCMAMIEQVDITPQRTFEMVPKIGNQVIVFGDASNVAAKLNKLQLFYKEVMLKAGWNYYSTINVQYKGQVVAKRRGAEDKSADSLRTLQLMQIIASNARQHAEDSLQSVVNEPERNADISIIGESIQRDDNEGADAAYDIDKIQAKGIPVIANPKPAVIAPVSTTPKRTPAAVAKPVVAPVKKPVLSKPSNPVVKSKPVTPVKKPAVTTTTKPVVKPAATTSVKPKTVPAKPKPAVPKPKPATKTNNDY